MGRKKELFLVLDTETANSTEQPLPYDIGWAICDRHGNIELERSYVVADIFLDLKDTMRSAYYAEKIPKYWDDIKAGNRIMKTAHNIRKQMLSDIKEYKIKKVCAYNMHFDKTALNILTRYTSKSFFRWWFPYGMEYLCIWNMACETILQQKTFYKMAEKNNWISESGNIRTNAEITYNYIKRRTDFIEDHTGLEDVRIEIEIMAHCFRQHKKMDKSINRLCWRKPTQAYKKWAADK